MGKPAIPPPRPSLPGQPRGMLFAVVAGLFFFIAIIKFGDPVIMDRDMAAPKGLAESIYDSWPSRWGIWLVWPLLAAGFWTKPWTRLRGGWFLALPGIWLGWELLAGTQSVGPFLTVMTLRHFAICVVLFYLGCFALEGRAPLWPIWTGMALALCWVVRTGLEQHFGGLEATRKLIFSGQLTSSLPPEVLKDPEFLRRILRDRIFSTFWNANAFAGALLLLLPLSLVFLWELTPKVRTAIRLSFVVILGGCGLAALYWTGSKAGWLIALVMGLVALWHSGLPIKWRQGLIGGILIVGITGFAVKYASFFHQERNSVGARFGYWRAACIILRAHPVFGTGPGTFQIPFARIKRPDDEMARLVHNDYLQQGCDSGLVGMVCYTGMTLGFLWFLYRYRASAGRFNRMNFAVWLGVFGVYSQSGVDCHLYVPALAWPAFFLLGRLMTL